MIIAPGAPFAMLSAAQTNAVYLYDANGNRTKMGTTTEYTAHTERGAGFWKEYPLPHKK